jgi:hypothetical protein
VAKAAAKEVHGKMLPAYRQATRVPALEAQIKRQAGLIEWLQRTTETLKALGAIGIEVDLDTQQGIQALQAAVFASKATPAGQAHASPGWLHQPGPWPRLSRHHKLHPPPSGETCLKT